MITELNPWDSFNPGRLDQHLYPLLGFHAACLKTVGLCVDANQVTLDNISRLTQAGGIAQYQKRFGLRVVDLLCLTPHFFLIVVELPQCRWCTGHFHHCQFVGLIEVDHNAVSINFQATLYQFDVTLVDADSILLPDFELVGFDFYRLIAVRRERPELAGQQQ